MLKYGITASLGLKVFAVNTDQCTTHFTNNYEDM